MKRGREGEDTVEESGEDVERRKNRRNEGLIIVYVIYLFIYFHTSFYLLIYFCFFCRLSRELKRYSIIWRRTWWRGCELTTQRMRRDSHRI